jgi:hypothetical protein
MMSKVILAKGSQLLTTCLSPPGSRARDRLDPILRILKLRGPRRVYPIWYMKSGLSDFPSFPPVDTFRSNTLSHPRCKFPSECRALPAAGAASPIDYVSRKALQGSSGCDCQGETVPFAFRPNRPKAFPGKSNSRGNVMLASLHR